MKISKVYSVYFSATYTTRKVVRGITEQLGGEVAEYDITSNNIKDNIEFSRGDVLVTGMPVYGGRIPASTLQSIAKLKGNGSPAIITCVYGNRDYDDALLELRNVVEARGFKVISASAFIARHSIFTQIATDRPTEEDLCQVSNMANTSKNIINSIDDFENIAQIPIKGNMPYKEFNQLPIYPSADESCVNCGRCAEKCPVKAIAFVDAMQTNEEKCIACGRCIIECPIGARAFRSEFYEARSAKFMDAFSTPKENQVYFAVINK